VVPQVSQPLYTAETVRVPASENNVWGLTELGDAVYTFTDTGVTVLRGGIAIATGLEPTRAGLGSGGPLTHEEWSVAVIPALDGDGRWVVAVRDGALYRVTLAGDFDPIGDRFGIHGEPVDDVLCAGRTIAIQLRNAVLVTTDGVHMQRYDVKGELAVARDRLAIHRGAHIEVWDLAANNRRTFAVDGKPMFVDADNRPRLAVQMKNELWLERDGRLLPHAIPPATLGVNTHIHVAGAKLWVQQAFQLFLWDEHRFVRVAPQPPNGWTFESRSGDLWVAPFVPHTDWIRWSGELQKISTTPASGDPSWQAQVAPVFQRVCSHCHLPGGEAGIDLSTPVAWASERDEIRRRVLVTRTMPPAGTDLSDADRAALEHYLGAK
jgi:hypothetical protein